MKLLSVKEASNLLGLPVNTIYQYVSRNKIPNVKIGSRTLFDLDGLTKEKNPYNKYCKDLIMRFSYKLFYEMGKLFESERIGKQKSFRRFNDDYR